MRTSWKILASLAAVALVGAGCGGINASQSVSPATFLMPGLLKNCPQCPTATNELAAASENPNLLASVR